MPAIDISFIERERKAYHHALITQGLLVITPSGCPSNADASDIVSKQYAVHVANALGARHDNRLKAQTLGTKYEIITKEFLDKTLSQLSELLPGEWNVKRNGIKLTDYKQFYHLKDIKKEADDSDIIKIVLGEDYYVKPDLVVYREPFSDSFISAPADCSNFTERLLKSAHKKKSYLHADISLKWTIRSDRTQNTRTEAQNIIRNRNGRVPHMIAITCEPLPSRIASLALGLGDLDCVYHSCMNELMDAATALQVNGKAFQQSYKLLKAMIEGHRLKDISELPLDLLD